MKVFDMHCDTLTEMTRRLEQDPSFSFDANDMHIDLAKLKQGDYALQNFAVFTYLKDPENPMYHMLKNVDTFYRLMDSYELLSPVTTYNEILSNMKEGKISCMLTIEEGAVFNHDLALLRDYYRLGVRMAALSWNFPNGITHPNFSEGDGYHTYDDVHGLTDFGKACVKEMERLGMIIDVSHMSDRCFYDVYELTEKPFVASHSNARAVTDHARNMSDDMILKLASRGGVMGINYSSHFLNESGQADVSDLVRHITYIRDLAGIDVIGLGSDFDGITSGGLPDASALPRLAKALREAHFSDEDIEKIFYKNVLRVYKDVLKK